MSINIGVITPSFYPDTMSDSLYRFLLLQSKNSMNISVYTFNKNNRIVSEEINNNFIINRLSGFDFSKFIVTHVNTYPLLYNLSANMKNNKLDIIHAHSHLFLTSYQSLSCSKKHNIPSMVTIHGVKVERGKCINALQMPYLYTLTKKILSMTDKIICLTKSDAYEIQKYGCNVEKIRIIPNPVDIEIYKPRYEYEKSNIITWTGRIVLEKGLNRLLKTDIILKRQNKDVKFTIIGTGPEENHLKQQIHNYGLKDYIDLVGSVPNSIIPCYLNRSAIFLFPSLKEGMPISVLEAMACGIPVIGSNIPGVKDLLSEDAGILVNFNDSLKVAEYINQLLMSKKLRRKYGKKARKRVEKNYSMSKILTLHKDIYFECLRNNQ